MYFIILKNDNTLSATKKQRIVQRSKLVDDFIFLVPPEYNGHDMTNATLSLEYKLPVSHEYKNELLTLSEERFEEYLQYKLPIDTNFTKEAGDIELQLTYIDVDIDADGNEIQRVRKTAPPLKVTVVPIAAWSDIIPDSALNALDQRIIKQDAQIKQLEDIANMLNEEKADNLKYDSKNNELQLLSGDKEIGNKVTLNEDGVQVVEFNNSSSAGGSGSGGTTTPEDERDVVEF